jgi:hypothetical protein
VTGTVDNATDELVEDAQPATPVGPRRVLVHVGTPKTGTSHLQDVLFRNRDLLREHGILYPADRFDAHFLAALDLMRLTWGGLETQAVGAWERVAAEVREWPGTSIVSHEILATASRVQVEQALTSLGLDDGAEIHIILSARDLVRQVPAEWQENVKHRATVTYAEFLARIQDPDRRSRIGSWFWGVQEIPDILERWAERIPPEHVHLVTVPPPGSDPDELWVRFSRTFGLDDVPLDHGAQRANPSLGVPETALLRRINATVNALVEPDAYRPLVREMLAHRTLSQRTGSPRLGLSPEAHAWATALSRESVDELRSRAYDVVGHLDELLGAEPGVWTDPDTADPGTQLPGAVDAIRVLLAEATRLRGREAELDRELHRTREQVEQLRHELSRPRTIKEHTVHRLQRSRAGRASLGVYRRLRARSSRSA